jgi:hypothetical protein
MSKTMEPVKIRTFVFAVFACSVSFAQNCDNYIILRDSCNTIYLANRSEPNLAKRKALYLQFQSLCARAASSMGQCLQEKNYPANTENSLVNTYVYAKALYNAGLCEEANNMYKICLNNPFASTVKKNNITYATYASGMVNTCKNPFLASNGNMAYILEYNGKSGAFIAEIYDQLQDQGLLSGNPLTAEEREEIIGRAVYRSDSANLRAVAVNLSGYSEYIYRYPFFFMKDSVSFLRKKIMQEKNLDPKESNAVPVPDLTTYADFIFNRYTYLKNNFFNGLNMGDRLISFYLIGGKYDHYGLENYLRFSNKIHARAQKQVAYYMALDNSVLAWTSSGGGTLIHEMIHALINNDFANAPFWINEGLASLYEETDGNTPIDNYRIIFIQEAFKNKKCFMPLLELFGASKYQSLFEEDYNLVNAYSRYFCKYVYDRFGIKKLARVYKELKQSGNPIPEKQYDLICTITGKTRNELQSDWQDYLLKASVPSKWMGLLATEMDKYHDPAASSVFTCSDILTSQDAIDRFDRNRKKDLHAVEVLKKEKERDGMRTNEPMNNN